MPGSNQHKNESEREGELERKRGKKREGRKEKPTETFAMTTREPLRPPGFRLSPREEKRTWERDKERGKGREMDGERLWGGYRRATEAPKWPKSTPHHGVKIGQSTTISSHIFFYTMHNKVSNPNGVGFSHLGALATSPPPSPPSISLSPSLYPSIYSLGLEKGGAPKASTAF